MAASCISSLVSLELSDMHLSCYEFGFNTVVRERVATELQKLNEAIPVDSIPGKILKGNQDIITNILQMLFNGSVINGTFPPYLKIGEITPVCKANDQTLKSNYRPITINHPISNFQNVRAINV